VLRHLLERWIAALPEIQAVDVERARDHEQAIVDLRQLIGSLEMEIAAAPATAADPECATVDTRGD
jgi:hypothetical protein